MSVSPQTSPPNFSTWCLRFSEKRQALAFEEFFRSHASLTAGVMYHAVELIASVFFKIYMIKTDSTFLTYINCCLLIGPIIGWCLVYDIWLRKNRHSANAWWRRHIASLESVWFIATELQFCLSTVSAIHFGRCAANESEGTGCLLVAAHRVSSLRIFTLLLFPSIMHVVHRSTTWIVVLIAWLCGLASIVYCIVAFDLYMSIGPFIFAIVMSGFYLVEGRRQNVEQFAASVNLMYAVSENKRMAEEVQANELRHMIGNVAHDLKTPLAAFSSGIDTVLALTVGVLEQVKDSTGMRASIVHSLNDAIDSLTDTKNVTHFMLMTINRCIDYAKCTKGLKLTPRLETINLKEMIELPLHCMRKMQSRLPIVMLPTDRRICSHIITDKQWLQENLLCLLSNAVKYSAKGTISVSLSLVSEARSPGTEQCSDVLQAEEGARSFIRFEVQDTGIGLTQAKMNGLFQPFKQAQRHAGGTGLGLFSLARRMEALGGFYGVRRRSDGEEGSVFWFEIPYVPDPETSLVLSIKEVASVRLTKSGTQATDLVSDFGCGARIDTERTPSRLSILLVDDSHSIQKLTSMMLKRQGHTVTIAENGAEALEMITRSGDPLSTDAVSFDVVLMDFQMPIMDGLEATRRVRQWERLKQLEDIEEHDGLPAPKMSCGTKYAATGAVTRHFIIGVSAASDHDTVEEAYAAGIDGFLQKPFTLQAFQEQYARHLDKSSS